MKNKYLYKSLPKNMSPHGHKFKVGKWYKIDEPLELCKVGFHASERAFDAMQYVNCEVLAKVEVRGKCLKEKDKECWSEMKLIKTYKWTKKDSVAMAIYAAELVLPIYEKEYPNDTRVVDAIKAAKKVLKNDTVKNRAAARAAAGAAARDAAGAAGAAARDAAGAAARAAAWAAAWAARAAAWAAAWAARAAARAAEFEETLDKIETWIHKRIKL